jgi:hypothetical protein
MRYKGNEEKVGSETRIREKIKRKIGRKGEDRST